MLRPLLALSLAATVVGAPPPSQDAAAPRGEAQHGEAVDKEKLAAAREAAAELEAVAVRLEQLAADAADVAKDARRRADAARKRADEIERGGRPPIGGPFPPPPKRVPDLTGPPAGEKRPPALRSTQGPLAAGAPIVAQIAATKTSMFGGPSVHQIHASALRSSEENKAAFLGQKRALRGWGQGRQMLRETLTYSPGQAPDLGDLDIRAEWQWAINVARGDADFDGAAPGSLQTTGHVDYARLTIEPGEGAFAQTKMKWGMRRYNLGDVTVVDCDFTGIPEEHGVYDALAGHGLYRGNTFRDLGGQALQVVYRDRPYQQYKADNLEFVAAPLWVIDDCHAVDTGKYAARSGFVWTLFDPGIPGKPGTVILRGCTSVQSWGFARTPGGESVALDAEDGIRSPGGLVLQHYRPLPDGAEPGAATRSFVVDRCLFDHTRSSMPFMAIRGVGTVLIEDSCFIARDCKQPFIDIDDIEGQPSGRVILQNCLSPGDQRVMVRVRKKVVCAIDCPGTRVEIDVATGKFTTGEVRDEPLGRVISPLVERTVKPGVHPQPAGHVDNLGAIEVPGIGAD